MIVIFCYKLNSTQMTEVFSGRFLVTTHQGQVILTIGDEIMEIEEYNILMINSMVDVLDWPAIQGR